MLVCGSSASPSVSLGLHVGLAHQSHLTSFVVQRTLSFLPLAEGAFPSVLTAEDSSTEGAKLELPFLHASFLSACATTGV